uniref:Rho guanine nucleotide exchange factor 25 n=1 Tax=Panagrellus redivivus TaxID=6233 RepID=A0A7E4VX50_PANRE
MAVWNRHIVSFCVAPLSLDGSVGYIHQKEYIRRFFNNSSSRESQPSSKASVARESPQSNASRQSVPDIHQQGQSSESPQETPDESNPTVTASGSEEPVPSNSNTTTNNMSTSAISHQPMDEPGVAEDPSVASSPSGTEPDPETPKTNGAIKRTPAEEARYKRQFVIQELVETERDYVTDLLLIVNGYMQLLSEQDLPEDLQGKDKIIFANIQQILEFHQQIFVKEIEKCLENYQAAGLAFVKYERRLHSYYVKYCQNKPKSDFLMAQEQFEQFFNETRLKLGEKRTLTDLLIKPVQRIQKYQLLMRDIVKYTQRAGDSDEALQKGLQVMCIVPKACDDMMQVGRLQNFDGNLNAQGKLLYQGLLQISESSPSQPFKGKERIVFLFEQSAIIADSIPKRTEFSSPTYIFKNQIMVNKMVLENNVADEPTRFVLRSNDPNQPLAFLCQAGSVEEKQQWLEKINAQLDQQKTLLAALVDPKRYQNQLANNFSALSLQNNKKDSSSSLGCPTSTSPNSALNSPKNATPPGTTPSKGSKLFGFGKKSSVSIGSRGPTSPH